MKNRGQVQLAVVVVGGIFTLLSSVAAAWGTSSAKVQVIEERENNHYMELKGFLEASEKRQQLQWQEVKNVLDVIAPPTVKTQSVLPKEERKQINAPLIVDVKPSGEPQNEND